MELKETAKSVKRGVKLLDKKVPGWRRTLKKHAAHFNITDATYCVLGTLEHHNGRMRVLNERAKKVKETKKNWSPESWGGFYTAAERLRIPTGRAIDFGFDSTYDAARVMSNKAELEALWRAEFE